MFNIASLYVWLWAIVSSFQNHLLLLYWIGLHSWGYYTKTFFCEKIIKINRSLLCSVCTFQRFYQHFSQWVLLSFPYDLLFSCKIQHIVCGGGGGGVPDRICIYCMWAPCNCMPRGRSFLLYAPVSGHYLTPLLRNREILFLSNGAAFLLCCSLTRVKRSAQSIAKWSWLVSSRENELAQQQKAIKVCILVGSSLQ